jgi:hypothetical protein
VRFRWKTAKDQASEKPDNALRVSLDLLSRSVGQKFEVSIRHPRPITYRPPGAALRYGPAVSLLALTPPASVGGAIPWGNLLLSSVTVKLPEAQPDFIRTSPDAWNEAEPFPTESRSPHYEKPKPGDSAIGSEDEVRHTQFPIAVAVETPLPFEWMVGRGSQPTVRVAAIGNGGVFVGPEISPTKEKLLLGRDDSLTRNAQEWHYPRVEMSRRDHELWKWAAWVGLPGLFAYLGVVVLLVRRLR